jgi:hypothetical protein
MSTSEESLTGLLNHEGDGPVLTKEWVDALLERQFPKMLDTLVAKRPIAIADFVKLAQLEQSMYPVKEHPRQVIWLDFVDRDKWEKND